MAHTIKEIRKRKTLVDGIDIRRPRYTLKQERRGGDFVVRCNREEVARFSAGDKKTAEKFIRVMSNTKERREGEVE